MNEWKPHRWKTTSTKGRKERHKKRVFIENGIVCNVIIFPYFEVWW